MRKYLIILTGAWVWFTWSMRAVWARLRGKSTTFIVKGWSDEGIRRVYEPLGISIAIEDNIVTLPDDKPIVLVGNHPTTFSFWAVGRAFDRQLKGKHPKVAGAMRHNFTPLGWALTAMGGIAINRTNREKAEQAIRKGLKDAQENSVVMIYPEGHRAFRDRIEKNQKRLADAGDEHKAKRFAYTLSGRPAGVHMIRQNLQDATWIRMYVSSDRPGIVKATQLEQLAGSTIHVHLSNIDSPPDDREGVKNWLDEELLGPCNDWIHGIVHRKKILERHIAAMH